MGLKNISSSSIFTALGTAPLTRNIFYYPTLSSTMDMAKKLVMEGISEGSVIITDEQTMGRGRMGRKWISAKGGSILMSIILHPALAELPQLNMIASLAVVQSIQEVTGLNPGIKWPNDVLVNGRKVSGILIENIIKGSTVNAAIVGIGINTNLCPSSFPEISTIATSLAAESGKNINQGEVLLALLKKFDQMMLQYINGRKSVYESWITHVETLGKFIQIKSGSNIEEGYAESIDTNGNLLLRRPDGSLITVVAGEVTLHIEG